MAGLLVVVAGLLETGFAVCLKLSHGTASVLKPVSIALVLAGIVGSNFPAAPTDGATTTPRHKETDQCHSGTSYDSPHRACRNNWDCPRFG